MSLQGLEDDDEEDEDEDKEDFDARETMKIFSESNQNEFLPDEKKYIEKRKKM
eukprot:CAMPEP_0175072850 /NCGR_PEP_ID=MMETSP0052_2-20121109/20170_1 /TAXON_ID=51329 ORGANISM="Polytomella parva, Strain SAG 63-3" /NCGR_SAMPLE_ID=MMETSP0052_2 /ASSEMBLY_ACC=CAM_ASM_000194 /LENGTH=52 /DNA_ID=CAMNT_0016340463 /DNA_START=1026 /DNA_END=1184 /DNA_ORIENTATION=+